MAVLEVLLEQNGESRQENSLEKASSREIACPGPFAKEKRCESGEKTTPRQQLGKFAATMEGGGERETTDEARIIAVKPISRKRPLSSPINGKQRDEKRESAVAFIRIDVRDKTRRGTRDEGRGTGEGEDAREAEIP
jgi:hypothetical protein